MKALAIILTSFVIGKLIHMILTDNKTTKSIDMNNTSKTLQYNQEQLDNDVDVFVAKIAAVRGYTMEDIQGKSRKRELVIVRQMICYLTRRHFASRFLSFQRIGDRINRDHSTVIYSYREIESMLERNDKYIVDLYNEVFENVGSESDKLVA